VTAYLIRRIAISVIVVLGITLLSFGMLHVIAPSPGREVLGDHVSIAAVNAFNKAHGYDDPVWVQFARYVWQLLHGNLGFSYKNNQSVDALLGENALRSAYLSFVSLFLAIAIAIPLGIFQAVKRNTVIDQSFTAIAFTTYSMPQNFLGLVLIAILALQFHLFPAQADQGESIWSNIADIHAMFLPILTLTATFIAGYSRYMRSSALDALAQDYIRLARAKGLSERRLLRKHLFRNSSLAMITLVGLTIPALLGGNLVIEYLYNFHGLGLLFINELQNGDFDTVIALTVIGGVLTVVGNLVADIALSVADPRIRIA
jgi:peptide/nickel transport system permease protein